MHFHSARPPDPSKQEPGAGAGPGPAVALGPGGAASAMSDAEQLAFFASLNGGGAAR
ncbi:hypothetical protein TSOC_000962 [Tetrabaena socialis]|uniref:Uncharacterized protein n=1 Tax=Tetrabaena socialis TaxID=47790 RepID=A0A2J8AI31_9CHLO|nr:hypothetical protein TSOC_000962 [Tetrabaena socialis]|eukprot:PNH12167.1 hypothetical protein TSOC_000962 [Tetrabaena socialis]